AQRLEQMIAFERDLHNPKSLHTRLPETDRKHPASRGQTFTICSRKRKGGSHFADRHLTAGRKDPTTGAALRRGFG
ncbi:hypothetical protein, partial [Devosia sp.]|uniref:hypothetical protein n=1 Tax=Devosia sp. TaxID=1871048 RepID=UPI00262AA2B6